MNDLRDADWIYPAAKDRTQWHEISQEHFDYFLNVLPPIWAPYGFLMSEAASHDGRGLAIRAYFVSVGGRHFVREVNEARHPEALAELLKMDAELIEETYLDLKAIHVNADPDQAEHAGRAIAFPALHSFSDFFPEVAPLVHETGSPELARFPSWEAGRSDRASEYCVVSGYVSVRGGSFTTSELPAFLLEYIRDNMLLGSYDTISFEVVRWEDGRALVLACNSQILGSRYLGIINADTIPERTEA